MTVRPLSVRFWLAQIMALEAETESLRERIRSFRAFGYHASADVLFDRLCRREASLAVARGKVLVTPSIQSQSETAAPQTGLAAA